MPTWCAGEEKQRWYPKSRGVGKGCQGEPQKEQDPLSLLRSGMLWHVVKKLAMWHVGERMRSVVRGAGFEARLYGS